MMKIVFDERGEGEESKDHHQLLVGASTNFMGSANKGNINNNISLNQFQHNHHISFGMMQSSSSSSAMPSNFINKDGGSYDLGELDQALFLYLDGQDPSQDPRQNSGMRPATLNIFPSQPMHEDPSTNNANVGLVSPTTSGSKRPDAEPSNTKNDELPPNTNKAIKREGYRKGPISCNQEGPKTPDPKILRRLAQNREAARKSRLRKKFDDLFEKSREEDIADYGPDESEFEAIKAYVQQLESSRIRLTQIEHELQRARAQGVLVGGGALLATDQGIPVINNISSEAAVFDIEYARWLDEHHLLMCDLRSAVQEQIPDDELRLFVDNCIAHYDEMVNLKGMVIKSDVFHIFSGMWKTPAERCFMWIGGFRPSEAIKIVVNQIEPLSEQQLLGVCGLQQSTNEAEEALSQGLESLYHSLSDTIASDALSFTPNMANYMGQMAVAMNKLSTLEGFVRQADNLRRQTLHRLNQMLTARQAARCFLAIAEYFHRLRALSSLWLSRPLQE